MANVGNVTASSPRSTNEKQELRRMVQQLRGYKRAAIEAMDHLFKTSPGIRHDEPHAHEALMLLKYQCQEEYSCPNEAISDIEGYDSIDAPPKHTERLEAENERLRDLLDNILTAQMRLRTVDEDDGEAWADALDRMIDLRKEADDILDRGGGGDG
ncbi:hypothetical protein [Salinibacter altiplanensis]|uniref:hypothetical protein n=1 Tax=Salinibacter altiplanensis TaxID=1803181 RepID=UPI000C9EE524|nr:hypothetical protein [Salinibacter altiplanensis]